MSGGFVLVILLLLMLFSGIPVGFGVIFTVIFGYFFYLGTPLLNLGQAMISNVNSFSLMAVFFYILAGQFLSHGRIAQEIVNVCTALVGKKKGGIAVTTVFACAMFGAVSGSTTATLVAIGGLMFPVMTKTGYSRSFTLAVILGAATLGIIVPPSIPEVLYGFLTGVSIFKLFISGVIPAAIIMILYVVYIRRNSGNIPLANVECGLIPFLKAFKSGIWAMLFPIIIFGGIISGVYTSNEAAVLAATYAFIIEIFVYKSITIKGSKTYILEAVITTGAVLFLVAGAAAFSETITYLQVPAAISRFCVENIRSGWAFYAMTNVVFLFAGMLVDNNSAILILTPVLYPLISEYGIDPVHFGFIMNLNLGIGYLTPPFASSLFLATSMFDTPYIQVVKSIIAPIIILLVTLLLCTYVPILVTFLPSLIG